MTLEVRALFILKRRSDYSTDLCDFQKPSVASGMFNSATFVSDMLQKAGIESRVVIVVDNNCIDREVYSFKPTHVFIEGFWVVPEKFEVLTKLHPTVKWTVRCHSEMPFLAQEGIAISWVYEYLRRGISVSSNSPRMNAELREITRSVISDVDLLTPLLPNYYPTDGFTAEPRELDDVLNISCFGAFRQLKNHLLQATAAVELAQKLGKKLRFHVNSGRVETNGTNPLKNLRALFQNLPQHELVEHGWTSHEEFLELLRTMDLSMQVSFTETFNIVSADSLSVGTPVVASSEIPYLYPLYADPTSASDMVKKLVRVWKNRDELVISGARRLRAYDFTSKQLWMAFLYDQALTDDVQKRLEKQLLPPARWTWPLYGAWLAIKTFLRRL